MSIKEIKAIIRPDKLDDVKQALVDIGILGLNITEVKGRGRGAGMQVYGRTGTYTIDLLPKIQICIVLSDHNVDATVKAIKNAAHTGEKGDGMIFVSTIDNVVRISTGEEGREAIMYQGDIDTRKK